ncbi:23S rRNA (uracil(1939)-C(5))-methyltransferase RlmD [Pseudodesulfovibrio sp.]|uniref:23S rRNA (uracil(1939)-C(5))-methyltransferase RlmD n=1 Tax=unclassified Pseudodesulfovibrio TaxID=2661612 RepID=UPI003B0086C5
MSISKDDVVECTIESLAFGGRGVSHVDGMAVFVAGGLPGDVVNARVLKAKKRFAEAETVSLVTPSALRVQPVCPHFGTCGGCAMQDLAYAEQLAQKAAQVESALARIGRVEGLTMDQPVASPEVWRYRNKMEFAFEQRDGEMHLGLRGNAVRGSRDLPPVVDVDECHLCPGRDMDILQRVRQACRTTGIPAYDPHTGEGFWRHLVIRHTTVGEIMAHLITAEDPSHYAEVEALAETLVSEFRILTSFVHSTRSRRAPLAVGDQMEFRLGPKQIEERLPRGEGEVRYHLSPNCFFQTNSTGAAKLFETVAEYGDFTGTETVLDLYCGIGAISVYLADRVAKVVGVELSEESVSKAWASAKLNSVTNAEFHAANLDNGLEGLKGVPRPDVVVVDPPRAGMSHPMAETILALKPEKILAVSCDPTTLARDVERLSDAYELKRARAVDMFPHTHHIETVALLVRR